MKTVDEFVAVLGQSKTAGVLVLVLDGDEDGRIEIEGKPVDLKDLTGVQLKVADDIYLEGESLNKFSGAATLKAKVKAQGVVRDDWEVVSLPQFAVEVDTKNDKRTHKIPSTMDKDGLTHFVTVKEKNGYVRLRARITTVDIDTPKNRKELKWDAPASYRLKNDQWALKISRTGTKKVTIPLKFKGNVVKKVVVWVVWCKLTPLTTLKSVFDNVTILGPLQTRSSSTLELLANIDWLLTIEPVDIISDKDRPDLNHQKPKKVPGENVVPDPFYGWDLAIDTRVFKKGVTPTGKEIVLEAKTEPGGYYRWPTGDAEGVSTADEDGDPHNDPYNATVSFHGWPSRWGYAFEDSDGLPGEIRGFHQQARLLARVQLDTTWYRCSDIKLYRHKDTAKMLASGKWDPQPGTKPLLELNNKNW